MRNLPHQPPVLFAQDRVLNEKHRIETEVAYDSPPTLEQLVEGAAQSCAFFDEDVIPTARWGYLVQIKNCSLTADPPTEAGCYQMQMAHEVCLGAVHQVSFAALLHHKTVATGTLQVALQEESS